MTAAVRFDDVTIHYQRARDAALTEVDLSIDEGEFLLVVGETGAGKSTLLRSVIGLVPHFSGGRLTGRVEVCGRDTEHFRPRDLADVVGFVAQNPATSFVADIVEDELAYTMENLGVAPATMRRRVEEVIDLMSLAEIRSRPLSSLSGGQQQRVAIGAVLTASPRVLVLDEPTSALDPAGAEEVLAALHRLCHDVGLTVILAEHRLERVIHLADRIAIVSSDGRVRAETATEAMRTSPVAPPIVELGRAAGWEPLPLSIRDARRAASSMRSAISDQRPPAPVARHRSETPLVIAARLVVDRVNIRALRGIDFTVESGEVVAVMGRNGSGKSTLLQTIAGSIRPTSGAVEVTGCDPSRLDGPDLIGRVGFVPQDAATLLYAASIDDEWRLADAEGGLTPGTTEATANRLGLDVDGGRHPLDLSDGQRLLVATAIVIAHAPSVLLLDEPTRGVDYAAKHHLSEIVRRRAAAGHAVVIATHDVELVATCATRAVVLADGEVIADGDAREVVCHSAAFSPQVARIMAPAEWLTVAEVLDAWRPAK